MNGPFNKPFPGPLTPDDLPDIRRQPVLPPERGRFVSSGYNAIRLLVRSLGLRPGTRAAVPALICPEVPGALAAEGLEPAWIDIDPEWFFMAFDRDVFFRHRLGLIVLPHLYGMRHPQTAEITAFARDNRIPLIHDAAQSFGLTWNGVPIIEQDQGGLVSFGAGKSTTAATGAWVFGISDAVAERYRLDRFRRWDPQSDFFLRQRMGFAVRRPWGWWPGAHSFRASRIQVRAARAVLARFDRINERRKANWDALAALLPPERYGEAPSRRAYFKYLLYSDALPVLDPALDAVPVRRVVRHVQGTGLRHHERMSGYLLEFSCERPLAGFEPDFGHSCRGGQLIQQ